MSSQTSMDVGFWEKLGDGLSAFSEGVGKFLLHLFGSSNERLIRSLGYVRASAPGATHTVIPGSLLAQVNELEEKMHALTDDELKALTPQFRERLAQGATLEDLLPEAFAACREAGWRTKNMRHFDVQILGGIVLHRGNIAEMVTGEGKTLVATLPAYLNALESKGVHVVTVNDYLARRDCEWMMPIYKALGLTAGYIQSDMDPVARRQAYDCDITYGTNSEFGFDYLRDNMKPARWGDNNFDPYYQQVQKSLNYAIIDEVDNILIDEARTPLIISGQAFSDLRRYTRANDIAVQLGDLQKSEPGRYFEIKEKEQTCHLTEDGIHKAEELLGIESMYTAGNLEWPHLIDNALKAHHLYKKDKRYAVMRHPETGEMSIIIIDEFTGRLMIGRQWSDGLHQAVEAKHARDGVKIKEETQTLATITLQNYFKLYKKLAGMTGTAMTEADEFWKIYKLDVIAIPTNKPLIRINHPDVIFRTEKEKWKASVDEIVEVRQQGRPILVGTTDVDKSLKLSDMLKRRGIKHELLNALPEHAARESEIVAQAGRIGAVTIATNMAGRGTDIILGGNPETLAWARLKDKYASRLDVPEEEWKQIVNEIETREKMKEEGRKVAEMGGMHIIGTERHDARRIDNQLRGRAGRQGDPGSSRFYLSLEDDLMRIFAGEWVSNLLARLGMQEGEAIESRMVSRRISAAQKKVEERHFDARKHLLEYDEVMDHQRKEVYGARQRILEGANCKLQVLEMLDKQIDAACERYLDSEYGAASFAEFAFNRLGVEYDASDFSRCDFNEADKTARDKAMRAVETQVYEMMEENLGSEDSKEWNWQALSNQVNARWGLKTNDRQLRQIGKDNMADYLREQANKCIAETDLNDGRAFLEPDWGVRSLCDWARLKFQIKQSPQELAAKEQPDLKVALRDAVMQLYRQREIEFPVRTAMARFMSDQPGAAAGSQRYNREGLFYWANMRFPQARERLHEEDFRTQPRHRLFEMLIDISRSTYPTVGEEAINGKLDEIFEGSDRPADAEDAKELAEWTKTTLSLDVPESALTKATHEQTQQMLWNAFDERYRPEMRQMERSLLLNQLDAAWKNHLYTMDYLRSGIGLRGWGQEDPKTVYKQEGMKEFKAMWEGIEDKVTDTVFRMEETEAFQESLWTIGATIHESAPRASVQAAQEAAAMSNNANGEVKVVEPIRNRGQKVGRNDPCPCGSGKKYKNCHMRQAV
ncbi:MAG TPA: preprotein translocase subunit SecA [Gemmataceae bacterium]|nr:preprotein translocase subunit SecA [Gemmataceae bacterium]